ncbi:hypothetical protein PLICRDRAFT_47017 [Plicaturopsis crispa FD-325 SS-3]|uniref:DUF6534 domain-containing protein n=1 Tax=Plicaturopsis crispa FD-325 SS-3 TaxID=944288 RepID=A0A0C9SKJ1_PLICR|nr:hypothetical protein PLICRDRAFT_47017 [Plicaturopsis crispa FD-325 SS-3]
MGYALANSTQVLTMSPAPAPVELDTTLGAVEIGIILSVCLFGTVNAQVYTYFRRFSEDRTRLKISVAVIWICDSIYTGVIAVLLYTMTVKSFGQPQKLSRTPGAYYAAITLGMTISTMSQAFFAHRIWLMSRKPYIAILSCTMSIVNLCLGVSFTLKDFQKARTWNSLILGRMPEFFTWLGVGAATDLVITVSLCYLLYKERSCSITRTVAVIDRLLIWTVQTGVITSFSSIAVLIILTVVPENYAWLAIVACLPQLFVASLLASLNARAALRRDLEEGVVMSTFRIPQARTCDSDAPHPTTRSDTQDTYPRGKDIDCTPVNL